MKPYLLDVLQCLHCGRELKNSSSGQELVCEGCGQTVPLSGSIPLFSSPPGEMVPSTRLERGPEIGTPWRRANWRFLNEALSLLPPDALILDVGAGRGDFAALLEGRHSLALEVYPYPEVDLVCDLTQANPFRPESFDAALLLNVMEHIYDTHALLEALHRLLKPSGRLVIAIPFMVKIHQAPVDFVRYTHFALERLALAHGFEIERLEGYYDPLFFLSEGLGNLRFGVLPNLSSARRYTARLLLGGIHLLAGCLGRLSGSGLSRPPAGVRSQAPTGYQVIFRKVSK